MGAAEAVLPPGTGKLSSDLRRPPETVLAARGSLVRGTAASTPAFPSPSALLDLALPRAVALFWLSLGGQQGQRNRKIKDDLKELEYTWGDLRREASDGWERGARVCALKCRLDALKAVLKTVSSGWR